MLYMYALHVCFTCTFSFLFTRQLDRIFSLSSDSPNLTMSMGESLHLKKPQNKKQMRFFSFYCFLEVEVSLLTLLDLVDWNLFHSHEVVLCFFQAMITPKVQKDIVFCAENIVVMMYTIEILVCYLKMDGKVCQKKYCKLVTS